MCGRLSSRGLQVTCRPWSRVRPGAEALVEHDDARVEVTRAQKQWLNVIITALAVDET